VRSNRYPFLNEAELQALENYWRCGQLQSRSDAIVNFVECHRDEILELAGENRDSAALIAATQRLICAYLPSICRPSSKTRYTKSTTKSGTGAKRAITTVPGSSANGPSNTPPIGGAGASLNISMSRTTWQT